MTFDCAFGWDTESDPRREIRGAAEFAESQIRDPSTADMDAALPRLVSAFADCQASGRLRAAVAWWKDRSRQLDKPRRVKAQLMLGAALDRLGAGDSP